MAKYNDKTIKIFKGIGIKGINIANKNQKQSESNIRLRLVFCLDFYGYHHKFCQ